ncbi:ABC transporter substrate-binding protein [Cellulosimicrobium protaetiae]|uniref:ABC transporter substrate-binding protein n=1 Tax=Cellulosimicrobium protaetiae TaxID=2587808 RepID=A0A6M5UI70_9MICO|nr:ABC transporter substrate-binding protein [Cellulosimicrobium protaetiae]QJW37804.1 ABC transporter substrate-binding protein [Cellulosimicrobium protaetiae]
MTARTRTRRPRHASARRAAAPALVLLTVGCGLVAPADETTPPVAPHSPVLTVGMPNTVGEEDNNPFDSGSAAQKLGYANVLYEPLAQVNLVDPAQDPTPWLASAWSWDAGYTELRVTVREGVTWSDGEPLTPDDVAFTFGLRRDEPALNPDLLPYEDVRVEGQDVVVTFGSGQYVNRTKAINTFVVPEHVWATRAAETVLDDPNLDPVGTGPYVLEEFAPDGVTLVARDDYWGGPLAVPELRYVAYPDNGALTAAYVSGEAQWGWAYIPSYESVYLAADPEHLHQFAPTGLAVDALFLNTQVPPFDDVAVRRAVNLVLDRDDISNLATSGVWPPLRSATGLPMPAGESFVSPDLADRTLAVDVEHAAAILEDAGYELVDGVLHDDEGVPVTFTLTNPAGWTDYMAELEMVGEAVARLGIVATVEGQDEAEWFDRIGTGDFQASMHWTDGGATPWDTYSSQMNGAHVRPIGTTADANFGRFQDAEADAAFLTYASSTDDAERAEALATIQRVYVEQVPAIPLLGRPTAAQYSTRAYTGFPSAEDPYASPQPTSPAASMILTRLAPGPVE